MFPTALAAVALVAAPPAQQDDRVSSTILQPPAAAPNSTKPQPELKLANNYMARVLHGGFQSWKDPEYWIYWFSEVRNASNQCNMGHCNQGKG